MSTQSSSAPAREALDRTLRLMRDDLSPEVSDDALLGALTAPRILVAADVANLASPAAQTALVATTLLVLRAGASVVVDAPDITPTGPQPPLATGPLVSALIHAGADLIEGVTCRARTPEADATDHTENTAGRFDVVVLVGDTSCPVLAEVPALVVRLGATATATHVIATEPSSAASVRPAGARWDPSLGVPFGALAAAAIAAGEVYKLAMRSLAEWALAPEMFAQLFGVSHETRLSLDPAGEVDADALAALTDLGAVDAVSGGAIIQAALFALARVPRVRADVRVIEPEAGDASNLNRYALLRRSALGVPKAEALAAMAAAGRLGGIRVTPVVTRYDRSTPAALGGLADAVLVGVDHIPTRWAAQKARPTWLAVGATSHYSAMSSDHARFTPCAWCLHPADEPDVGPIPTVAFVSHWAGLLLAWRLVRYRLGLPVDIGRQYDFFTPLRPDFPAALWRSPVAPRRDCPNACCRGRRVA